MTTLQQSCRLQRSTNLRNDHKNIKANSKRRRCIPSSHRDKNFILARSAPFAFISQYNPRAVLRPEKRIFPSSQHQEAILMHEECTVFSCNNIFGRIWCTRSTKPSNTASLVHKTHRPGETTQPTIVPTNGTALIRRHLHFGALSRN